MKILVVYYSLSGNTKLMAEQLAQSVGADVLELKLKQDIAAKGFMKYLQGGRAAMKKEQPELLPFTQNPQEYDLLFIGTPVWAWTYTPALNTFFATSALTNKKIALFCCHGGGKGNIFEKMKEALAGNEFVGEIDFVEPAKSNTQEKLEAAKQWAEGIVNRV